MALSGRGLAALDLLGLFQKRGEECIEVTIPIQPLGNHMKDRSSYLFLLLYTWWLEAPEQDDGVTGKDHRGGRY